MAPTGVAAFQYGTGEKSCLSQPRGLHLDEDGNLYVADFGNFCVVRFAADGGNSRVVVGQRGKQLLDVDYLKDIDKPLAPADGEGVLLKNPIDVALSGDGAVLVLDCPMGRVQCFEQGPKSSLATVVVPPPKSMPAKSLAVPEAIKHPRSMLCLDGSLVICDTWSHRVLKYGKDALTPELLAGTPNSCGSTEQQLNFPSCIAFDADGCLLVADTNNHRIQRFKPGDRTGSTVAGSAAGKGGDSLWDLSMPTGLAVEPDGALLVADRGNARVLRIREGLQPELLLGPDLLERPWGLAVDKDGGIFVSDERRGVVLRLLPPGSSPPANAKPAAAVAQAVKTPQPAVVPAAVPAESPSGGYPKVTPKAAPAFQPPERSKATAPAPAPAAPAAPAPAPAAPAAAPAPAATPAAPKAAVFQPPERTRNAASPAGEPPKLPKEEQPPPAAGHVSKDPLGLDDLD